MDGDELLKLLFHEQQSRDAAHRARSGVDTHTVATSPAEVSPSSDSSCEDMAIGSLPPQSPTASVIRAHTTHRTSAQRQGDNLDDRLSTARSRWQLEVEGLFEMIAAPKLGVGPNEVDTIVPCAPHEVMMHCETGDTDLAHFGMLRVLRL